LTPPSTAAAAGTEDEKVGVTQSPLLCSPSPQKASFEVLFSEENAKKVGVVGENPSFSKEKI
jgi:hypothetical protein